MLAQPSWETRCLHIRLGTRRTIRSGLAKTYSAYRERKPLSIVRTGFGLRRAWPESRDRAVALTLPGSKTADNNPTFWLRRGGGELSGSGNLPCQRGTDVPLSGTKVISGLTCDTAGLRWVPRPI